MTEIAHEIQAKLDLSGNADVAVIIKNAVLLAGVPVNAAVVRADGAVAVRHNAFHGANDWRIEGSLVLRDAFTVAGWLTGFDPEVLNGQEPGLRVYLVGTKLDSDGKAVNPTEGICRCGHPKSDHHGPGARRACSASLNPDERGARHQIYCECPKYRNRAVAELRKLVDRMEAV